MAKSEKQKSKKRAVKKPRGRSAKSEPLKRRRVSPKRDEELPVTVGMLNGVRDELKADIASVAFEVKAMAIRFDARFKKSDQRFKSIDRRFEQIDQ